MLLGLLLCTSHVISSIFHGMAQVSAVDPKSVKIQLDVAAVNKSPKAGFFTDSVSPPSPILEAADDHSDISHQLDH